MTRPDDPSNARDDALDFGIVTGQHWRSWEEIREQWLWAEESGWDSAWAFDRFFSLRDGEAWPTLEGWTLLAGLATITRRLRIGLMVTGNTHRNPAVLAKQAVTVDHLSNGRLILGMGAGWNEREHKTYGIDFPSPAERVDRFEEAMEVIRTLETQERSTFTGRYYRLDNAPFEPKPVQGHVPLLIGTAGKCMLRHVARYADLWDGGESPDEYQALGERLNALCREIGRDPGEIRWVFSAYAGPLSSEKAFRQHVASYASIGVRSFLFNIPTGPPNPFLRRLADHVVPELREQFKAGELPRM